MFSNLITLLVLYVLFKYIVAWIEYFNKTDERFQKSIWRYSYDYKVIGKRDISDLDDKVFVRLRRRRNRTVTFMFYVLFLFFIILMSFISNLLILMLN